MEIKEAIAEKKIIAILRGIEEDKLLPTVEAILRGGVECVEITMVPEDEEKTNKSLECLAKLNNHNFQREIFLGAGTVVYEEHLHKAIEAGAEYIVSPHFDVQVVEKTKEKNKISIPGASTPSEIAKAYQAGADFVKFFPASDLGPGYLSSIRGPFASIPIFAVGGINPDNAEEFKKAGASGIGVGSGLADSEAIEAENFAEIENRASKLVEVFS